MRKVLTGGVYDLIHLGHVKAFEFAKSFGDYLVVQVASDEEAKIKNPLRPIIPEKERMEMVRAIRYVDEVVCIPGSVSWPDLIDMVKPSIIVLNLGSEHINPYLEDECVKRDVPIIKMPRRIPESKLNTTKIIDKILTVYK